MKRTVKQIRKKIRRVDKVFLVGFVILMALSLALSGLTTSWLATGALGAGVILWQVMRR